MIQPRPILGFHYKIASEEFLATLPHRALRQCRHTSSSWQIRNIFSRLEILNYYPDGQNGDFQFFSYFLTATFYFVMLNLLMHIRTTVYYLVLHIVMDD